jgi:hypothetical protein
MIASFRNGFIFVKTRKTAGSSVEIALSRFCGPDDILTPLDIDEEELRAGPGKFGSRNFTSNYKLARRLKHAVARNDAFEYRQLNRKVRKRAEFFNHIPATRIREQIDPVFWERSFKFAIERHPYEKTVSMAYFRLYLRGLPAEEFQAMLEDTIQSSKFYEQHLYCDDGKPIVDRILKYEDLDNELKSIEPSLGISLPPLPRVKSGHRMDRRPAYEILSASQRDRISEIYTPIFDRFGYAR